MSVFLTGAIFYADSWNTASSFLIRQNELMWITANWKFC